MSIALQAKMIWYILLTSVLSFSILFNEIFSKSYIYPFICISTYQRKTSSKVLPVPSGNKSLLRVASLDTKVSYGLLDSLPSGHISED